MTTIRADPRRQRFPAFSGLVIVDVWRGRLRVRKWPRKRGPRATLGQRIARDWFRQSVKMYPRIAPELQVEFMDAVKGSGLYPRDLFTKSIGRGIYEILLPDGTVIKQREKRMEDVAFQGVLLELTTPFFASVPPFQPVPWPLPVRDTATFWSAGEPTRITVPPGVEFLSLGFQMQMDTNGDRQFQARITKNGADIIAYAASRQNGARALQVSTGPLLVAEGDYFEALVWSDQTGNLFADARNRFWATIEGTV